MSGIFSRQSIGAGAPLGYVCHVDISIGTPFLLPRGGRFVLCAGEDTRRTTGLVHTSSPHGGGGYQRSDPRMRVNMAGLAGGDGQVYDVTT